MMHLPGWAGRPLGKDGRRAHPLRRTTLAQDERKAHLAREIGLSALRRSPAKISVWCR